MALMTVCPACNTGFKVVQDQLRLHNGLVRCGACAHVFDASSRLQNLPESSPNDSIQEMTISPQDWINKPAVLALTGEGKPADLAQAQWTNLLPDGLHKTAAVPSAPEAAYQSGVGVLNAAFNTPAPALHAGTIQKTTNPQTQLAFDTGNSPSSHAQRSVKPANEMTSGATKVGANILTFLLALLSLVAGLVILAQVLMAARYVVANQLPASKPMLLALCELAACKVEPAQWLTPLVLDALSLVKANASVVPSSDSQTFRIQATVSNRSQLTVQTPDIELTVSNAQGNTIARKTLTPKQLGGAATLAANSDWIVDSVLMMDPQTVGYTARLVYLP